MEWLVLLLVSLRLSTVTASFRPNTRDLDAYGIKIAGNAGVFVQANSRDRTLLIGLAPFRAIDNDSSCFVSYPDPAHYIYTLGIGSKQFDSKRAFFYYAGEVVPPAAIGVNASGYNGTFIAVMSNENIAWDLFRVCIVDWSSESIRYLSSYGHQEYLVIAIEPYGQYAIGIATDFIFRYQPYPTSSMMSQPTNGFWPNNSTFHPCATDATEAFTIVAGFVKNLSQSQKLVTPTVHILSNKDLTFLTSWSYASDENTWQLYLTDSDMDSWSSKLTMSISINDDDPTRVLLGVPLLGTVFLFQVSNNGINLTLASSVSYEKPVGFGKSVAWLSNTQAAILYSAYSPDYSTFYWSKIYVYTCLNDTTLPSSPTAMIPNAQQPLPSNINANFIRMISTPKTVAILDQVGGVLLIRSEEHGSYASTDTTKSPVATTMPVVSEVMPCISGTFKSDVGIHPCSLCPVGSRSSGRIGAIACVNCSADAFCPLGAVYEVDRAALTSFSQAYPYPRSPELTVYEDVLINNMVSFGSTPHCRRISPMFWTMILLMLVMLMLFGMASLNLCVEEPRRDRWRWMIKRVFLRTDLVVSDTFGRISQ